MLREDILKNLPYFVQTAQLGSFSAAAKAMNLTPSAISKNVSLLEQSLGFRLFNRTTRSLRLTEEGSALLQQTSNSLDTLATLIEQLKPISEEPMGVVKISVANVIGRHILLPLLDKFYQQYPKIQLFLDFDDHVVDIVKGGYDLVIRGGHIADSSLILRPLMPLPLALAASTTYLQKYAEPTTLAELAQHRHIIKRLADGKTIAWQFRRNDGGVDFYPAVQPILTVSDSEAIMQAVAQGIGIGEVPYYLLKPYLDSGEVKILMPKLHYAGDYQLVMLYPHRSLLAKRVVCTIEFFLQQIKANYANSTQISG